MLNITIMCEMSYLFVKTFNASAALLTAYIFRTQLTQIIHRSHINYSSPYALYFIIIIIFFMQICNTQRAVRSFTQRIVQWANQRLKASNLLLFILNKQKQYILWSYSRNPGGKNNQLKKPVKCNLYSLSCNNM